MVVLDKPSLVGHLLDGPAYMATAAGRGFFVLLNHLLMHPERKCASTQWALLPPAAC